jgi:hypothetical protein
VKPAPTYTAAPVSQARPFRFGVADQVPSWTVPKASERSEIPTVSETKPGSGTTDQSSGDSWMDRPDAVETEEYVSSDNEDQQVSEDAHFASDEEMPEYD